MFSYLRLSLDFLTCTVPSGATRTVLPRMVDSSSSTTVKCLGFLCFSFGTVTALDDPEIHIIIILNKKQKPLPHTFICFNTYKINV